MSVAAKTRREAAKLYGLVLRHRGILNPVAGGSPCIVNVREVGNNSDDQGQTFKAWFTEDKIYVECMIASKRVSIYYCHILFCNNAGRGGDPFQFCFVLFGSERNQCCI